jgi:hypothetical protein
MASMANLTERPLGDGRSRLSRFSRPVGVLAGLAVLSLSLLVSACGGSNGPGVASAGSSSPSRTSGGSSNAGRSQSSQLLAFAACMRSHKVPNFPDPTSDSKFPGAQQLGVSSPQFQAAMNACKHLLPNGGNAPNQTELQRQRTALLPFARCMRHHGVPDWPDPSIHTAGAAGPNGPKVVVFYLVGTSLDGNGINSSQVHAGEQQCNHLLPPSNGGPPYGIMRSHG